MQMIDIQLEGSYGEVYLGSYLEAEVAMKRLKDMEDVKEFERELSLLRYSKQ
jgi:serine/threonine protein kinase